MAPSSFLTPSERALRARIASYTSWANTPDPAARTAPAREAAMKRFEAQVDPDGTLPPEERARRATAARKAYFAALALKSARARRRATDAAVAVDVLHEVVQAAEAQMAEDLGGGSHD